MEIMVLALGFEIFCCSSSLIFLPTATPNMRTSTVWPPQQLELNSEDAYFPDALEKYFSHPACYEDLTYFQYFQQFEISKKRIMNRDGLRPGVQDGKGYWIYSHKKTKLIRTSYHRLCDRESFFFIHLLRYWAWRSDEEILGGMVTYRDRLFALDPITILGTSERWGGQRFAIFAGFAGKSLAIQLHDITSCYPIDQF